MILYLILKRLHVLLAITAVGANVTYGVWLARAGKEPKMLPFTLRGVQVLDERIANPAYGLLLVTGLAMVFVGGLSLTTPWILVALVLFVALALTGALGYTPTLREQIRLAESVGPGAKEYRAMAQRGTTLGIVLAVIAVVIVFVMVTKLTF
jgi:uncharacterized membrane protein